MKPMQAYHRRKGQAGMAEPRAQRAPGRLLMINSRLLATPGKGPACSR